MKKKDSIFIATSHFKEHINLSKDVENKIKNHFDKYCSNFNYLVDLIKTFRNSSR